MSLTLRHLAFTLLLALPYNGMAQTPTNIDNSPDVDTSADMELELRAFYDAGTAVCNQLSTEADTALEYARHGYILRNMAISLDNQVHRLMLQSIDDTLYYTLYTSTVDPAAYEDYTNALDTAINELRAHSTDLWAMNAVNETKVMRGRWEASDPIPENELSTAQADCMSLLDENVRAMTYSLFLVEKHARIISQKRALVGFQEDPPSVIDQIYDLLGEQPTIFGLDAAWEEGEIDELDRLIRERRQEQYDRSGSDSRR